MHLHFRDVTSRDVHKMTYTSMEFFQIELHMQYRHIKQSITQ